MARGPPRLGGAAGDHRQRPRAGAVARTRALPVAPRGRCEAAGAALAPARPGGAAGRRLGARHRCRRGRLEPGSRAHAGTDHRCRPLGGDARVVRGQRPRCWRRRSHRPRLLARRRRHGGTGRRGGLSPRHLLRRRDRGLRHRVDRSGPAPCPARGLRLRAGGGPGAALEGAARHRPFGPAGGRSGAGGGRRDGAGRRARGHGPAGAASGGHAGPGGFIRHRLYVGPERDPEIEEFLCAREAREHRVAALWWPGAT